MVPGICGTYIRTLTANRAFINELVTSDAFIRKLAAQMITLQDGGVIKSSNYNGDIKKRNGTKGFALDSDGNADFVDMHATGGTFTDITANNMTADGGTFSSLHVTGNSTFDSTCTFCGDIYSGPLVLSSLNPSVVSDILNYNKGDSCQSFINYLNEKDLFSKTQNVSGYLIYNESRYNFNFYTAYKGKATGTGYNPMKLYLYDSFMKSLNIPGLSEFGQISLADYTPKLKSNNWPCSIQIGFFNPTGKTFKLLDLPTNEPSIAGAIWVDSGGILHIKR